MSEETLEEILKKTTNSSGLKKVKDVRTDYVKLGSDGIYTINTLDEHYQDKEITLGESFDAVIIYNRTTISEFPSDSQGKSKPLVSTSSVVKDSDFAKCRITGVVDTFANFRKNNPNAKVQTVLGLVILHPEYDKKFAELVLKNNSTNFRNPKNISNHIDNCNEKHKHPSLCVTKFGFANGEYQGIQYVYNTFSVVSQIADDIKDVIKNATLDDVKRYTLNQDAMKSDVSSPSIAPPQVSGGTVSQEPTVNPDDIPF